MGNAESNESAAVKRQAEGFSNPMYRLLDLGVRFDNHPWSISSRVPGRGAAVWLVQALHDHWEHSRAGRGHPVQDPALPLQRGRGQVDTLRPPRLSQEQGQTKIKAVWWNQGAYCDNFTFVWENFLLFIITRPLEMELLTSSSRAALCWTAWSRARPTRPTPRCSPSTAGTWRTGAPWGRQPSTCASWWAHPPTCTAPRGSSDGSLRWI